MFVVSDRLVETRFGVEGGSGAVGVLLGAVVDGIPESLSFEDSYRGRAAAFARAAAGHADRLALASALARTPSGRLDHCGLRRSDGVGMTRTNSSRISTRR